MKAILCALVSVVAVSFISAASTIDSANKYAYGGNIGWINFEDTGNPQLDLTTGAFSGYAWSANCGWINLGQFGVTLVTSSITAGTDSDNDGIADAFELFYAGNLTTMNATTDSDGDGSSDAAEYAAGTNPMDRNSILKITFFNTNTSGSSSMLTWTSQLTRKYRIQKNDDLNTPWELAEDNISPTGASTGRTLPDTAADKRFFRVQALSPLAP